MTHTPDHCRVCPYHLNDSKQLSIALKALRNISKEGNQEAAHALRNIRVLAGLKEPALCDQQEGCRQ